MRRNEIQQSVLNELVRWIKNNLEKKLGRLSTKIIPPKTIIAIVKTVELFIFKSILSSVKLFSSFSFSISLRQRNDHY